MARIYDFLASRTLHLLGDVTQQVENAQCDMVNCQACLTEVSQRFEKNILYLRLIEDGLEDHKKSCNWVQDLTAECRQVLETEDMDEMIKYRDKWLAEKKVSAKNIKE